MSKPIVTIERFITEKEHQIKGVSGAFSNILISIALASKYISRDVNKAGLTNILGKTGGTNVQGEEVQKLDFLANQTLVNILSESPHIATMASEEMADPIFVKKATKDSKYAINFDPLDGSSNIDANVSIGTIFSILRRVSKSDKGTDEDLMQPGKNQVAAGYVIYGSSTMLVYTTGNGVHGFTFDPSIGEFLLSHEDIKIPRRGKIYSVNEGNRTRWLEETRNYIDYLKKDDPETNRPYSSRYIGSLVADFHRNLMYGGIFLYPSDQKNKQGKLRLLYEASPLAMVVEQAGGSASNGKKAILDIIPENLHQRTPLIIGSKEDVEEACEFLNGKRKS